MNCERCRFWDKSFYKEFNNDETRGWCKRRSPVVVQYADGQWPITHPNDWCGEFEDKACGYTEKQRKTSYKEWM